MKNLHSITVYPLEAWIWYTLYGGNGQRVEQGISHLYRLSRRSDLPPLGDGLRRYWSPWTSHVEPREPLCDRLRTRARFLEPYRTPEWDLTRCENCERIATERRIEPQFQPAINRTDPWHDIPDYDRINTPDPVTGA